MSQSSLLTQLKLQRKLQKSQSQPLICDSLDSLGEDELDDSEDEWEKPTEELGEAIASLVLLHFFYLRFKQIQGESSARFYARRHKYVQEFFSNLPVRKETFPAFPVHSLVSAYPVGIVCECGTLFSTEAFGVIPSCLSCYGMGRPSNYWYGHLAGDLDLAHVPRSWHNWAQSVAIQFETARKSNHKRVTDFGETS